LILFIHGFGSCGWGSKSLALRRHFGIGQVIAPDLPFHPREAITALERLIGRYPVEALVGSSLGGFYATWLNRHADLPGVLINPVVHPHDKLAAHLGAHRRWCDDMAFAIGPDWLDALKALQRTELAAPERYLVLLQSADEVLDYREAARFYRDKDLEIIAGGSHRFEGFDTHLPQIASWLTQGTPAHHGP